jgi:hypothetical protein
MGQRFRCGLNWLILEIFLEIKSQTVSRGNMMATIPSAEQSARKILALFVNERTGGFLTIRLIRGKWTGHHDDLVKGLKYAFDNEWLREGEGDNIFLTEKGFQELPEKEELIQIRPHYVSNFITGVHNSQIQLQTSHSSQVINQLDLSSLNRFADELLGEIEELDIDAERKKELDAEISTIRAQTASPNPKQPILRECLYSIRRILEAAGGGVAAGLLLTQLAKMIG